MDLIKAADCGWWVAPGDVPVLAAMIDILSADSIGLLEKRANAYRYAHVHFGQDALGVEGPALWEVHFKKVRSHVF